VSEVVHSGVWVLPRRERVLSLGRERKKLLIGATSVGNVCHGFFRGSLAARWGQARGRDS